MIHRLTDGGEAVSEVFLLSERQMERIEPFFPLAHGVPRVDDRRVLSGIVYVLRNGLQWKDAPKAYGPHKTLYNRFIRWSRLGVFDRIFVALTEQADCSKRHLIENMFAKLKDWRRVATRYDRCAHTFMSAIQIAASFIFYLKE